MRAAILLLLGSACLWCQPVLPSWLKTYPGVRSVNVRKEFLGASMTVVTYDAPAASDDVRAHYQALFEEQGLKFAPTATGPMTAVHAVAECGDLTLTISEREKTTAVKVTCAVKLGPATLPTGATHAERV